MLRVVLRGGSSSNYPLHFWFLNEANRPFRIIEQSVPR